jgi:LysR family hydrogen peroxide-inducible transcriptional activator
MIALPTFQQLRFLCALAELRHFGKAAESCAVTQSTLSGGIRELEARLGVALFNRSHRTVMLTPVGKEIAASAQRPAPVGQCRGTPRDGSQCAGAIVRAP